MHEHRLEPGCVEGVEQGTRVARFEAALKTVKDDDHVLMWLGSNGEIHEIAIGKLNAFLADCRFGRFTAYAAPDGRQVRAGQPGGRLEIGRFDNPAMKRPVLPE